MRKDDRDTTARRERSIVRLAVVLWFGLFAVLTLIGLGGAVVTVLVLRSERNQRERVLTEKHAQANRVIASRAAGKVSAEVEGQNWTHAELLAHLNAKGMQVRIEATEKGGPVRGPSAVLVPFATEYDDESPLDLTRVVFVKKLMDSAAARDGAEDDLGTAFAWGRFLFTTRNRNLADQIRTALGMDR